MLKFQKYSTPMQGCIDEMPKTGCKPMITLKIENSELEYKLAKIAEQEKKGVEDVAIKAIKNFLDSVKKQKFIYNKKNVTEHMHVIHKDYDVDDVDDIALQHIQNSAEYIHNQRREVNK